MFFMALTILMVWMSLLSRLPSQVGLLHTSPTDRRDQHIQYTSRGRAQSLLELHGSYRVFYFALRQKCKKKIFEIHGNQVLGLQKTFESREFMGKFWIKRVNTESLRNLLPLRTKESHEWWKLVLLFLSRKWGAPQFLALRRSSQSLLGWIWRISKICHFLHLDLESDWFDLLSLWCIMSCIACWYKLKHDLSMLLVIWSRNCLARPSSMVCWRVLRLRCRKSSPPGVETAGRTSSSFWSSKELSNVLDFVDLIRRPRKRLCVRKRCQWRLVGCGLCWQCKSLLQRFCTRAGTRHQKTCS